MCRTAKPHSREPVATTHARPQMASANHVPFPTAGIEELQTLPALLRWRVERTPLQQAYRQFDDTAQRWTGYSWREIDRQVAAWRRAIDAEQLNLGDRI